MFMCAIISPGESLKKCCYMKFKVITNLLNCITNILIIILRGLTFGEEK